MAATGPVNAGETALGRGRMRLRLSPRENVFYELFSASAANILDGAQLLQKLVNAPVHEREDLHRQLRDAEHRGDDRTHSIMREVNSTFVTPLDREDIYRLASRLDDVMDFFEAAGDLIVLYKLEWLPREVQDLTDI